MSRISKRQAENLGWKLRVNFHSIREFSVVATSKNRKQRSFRTLIRFTESHAMKDALAIIAQIEDSKK